MSKPKKPVKAKLVVSVLALDNEVILKAIKEMTARFGPVDLISEVMEFSFTDYYTKEMGSPLIRRVVSFVDLVEQEELAGIKLVTNSLEDKLSQDGKRRANLDPGIVTQGRLVLATGKDFAHRIYLKDGIFGDLTLIYRKGGFTPLPWTYPDYREKGLKSLLNSIRSLYLKGLKWLS